MLGEDVADLRFPLGMAIGDGDFAVHRLAVAIVVGDGLVHRDAVLECQLGGVAHDDGAVFGEAQGPGIEAPAQLRVEAFGHACLDRLDRRGLDGDVGLRLRMGAANADQAPWVDAREQAALRRR